MSSLFTVNTTDLDKFENKLNNSKVGEEALRAFSELTMEQIYNHTPVDPTDPHPGQLRDHWVPGGDKRGLVERTPVVHTGSYMYQTFTNNLVHASWVEYGHFQEVGRKVAVAKYHGTLKNRWVPGRHYMAQGIEAAKDVSYYVVHKAVVDTLKKEWK